MSVRSWGIWRKFRRLGRTEIELPTYVNAVTALVIAIAASSSFGYSDWLTPFVFLISFVALWAALLHQRTTQVTAIVSIVVVTIGGAFFGSNVIAAAFNRTALASWFWGALGGGVAFAAAAYSYRELVRVVRAGDRTSDDEPL